MRCNWLLNEQRVADKYSWTTQRGTNVPAVPLSDPSFVVSLSRLRGRPLLYFRDGSFFPPFAFPRLLFHDRDPGMRREFLNVERERRVTGAIKLVWPKYASAV